MAKLNADAAQANAETQAERNKIKPEAGLELLLRRSVGRHQGAGRRVVILPFDLIFARSHRFIVCAVFVSRHSLFHTTDNLGKHLALAHRRLTDGIACNCPRANTYHAAQRNYRHYAIH
jgi:hypothetical protein